jgi:hypothetical protein
MKVVCDLFPARIRVAPATTVVDPLTASLTARYEGSRLVDAVRVVLTNDSILVAADSSDGPMLIFRDKYDPATLRLDRTGRTVSFLETTSGKKVIFEKDENCGCGSRLRSWNPYRIVGSSNDPVE